VLAARDADTGTWWYWFSWAERILAAGDPEAAAEAVIAALSVLAGAAPGAGALSLGSPGTWR
jgi:hypothetical protein